MKEVPPIESTALGLQFALDLGVTIALPAVLFGFIGRYIDKQLGSAHVFLFLGMGTAFVLSFIIIFRKLKVIMARMPKVVPKKKEKVDPELAKEQEILHDLFRPPSP